MALSNLRLEEEERDYIWVHIVADKMDAETRRQWELHTPGDKVQTMDQLKSFLDERARALEVSGSGSDKANSRAKSEAVAYNAHAKDNRQCPSCCEKHSLYSCVSTVYKLDMLRKTASRKLLARRVSNDTTHFFT